ncbi:MAG: exo-beta-N-acetylmuramidase NamZ domain-containing protein [Bacteroidota bacterium]
MSESVLTGLDVLAEDEFSPLRGLRLGLLTNHTAISRRREHLLDLLLAAGCDVKAIFSPEHGFAGKLDEPVASGVHEPTGIPVHSLYGNEKKPAPEALEGLDALVYDIADVGLRFYTYTTTMTHCMAAAAEAGLQYWVLDRPNPIRGDIVEGPTLDHPQWLLSAWHPLPLRHGLTSGELAHWARAHYGLDLDLRIAQCRHWRREQWFHETGLPWINPSPNMRNLRQAVLYPTVGTLEACNLSVGRGTDTPFELFGAPYVDDLLLARELNAAGIDEMAFVPIEFTPTTREFVGEKCRGVYIVTSDWSRLQTVKAAVQISLVLQRLWPECFGYEKLAHLLGSQKAVASIGRLDAPEAIVGEWQAELGQYRSTIIEHHLYQ